ncbi:Two-component hybrid sensor and regulator [hydrothermal vent metagenome]|uniref:histidine kinase n=1 Tax=hydrothermal vent metagenome TaxID=652676 RepID=A0A3B0VQ22_9ZZZZ
MLTKPLVILLFIGIIVFTLFCIYRLRNRLLKSQLELAELKTHIKDKSIGTPDSNQYESKSKVASAAKTRYLSGISHELRTPLNVIMGYAQLLEKQATCDDPNKDKYALMRHNCAHLNHLIEGILEFSAIEAGKLKVQLEAIDLHDLINQVTTMFDHQAVQKGLIFSSYIDPKLPKTVKTDHKRLQQILMNLLSNAIKFTESGQLEFNITYRNQVATFSITDSGRGIETNDLTRIFQPFERIEQPNKPIKGTGLGLPITRLLVDLLGGELKVESEVNRGSVFTVKLMLAPLAGMSNNQFEFNNRYSEIETIDQQQGASHTILVVDDVKSHRDLLTEILKTHQFKISTAASAIEAQDSVNQQSFSLAIIDVSMPEINGWQLATWFKSHSPKTKIMMLSANPRDVEASSDKPYDAYLTKPIKINQLMSDISHLLELGWKQSNQTNIQANNNNKIMLPDEHRSALINMLDIGHINGIESYLKKLIEQQVINEPQHQQLSQPIKAMNLTAFKEMIKYEH